MFKCNSLPQEETLSKLKELDKDGKLNKYQELAQNKLIELFDEFVKFEKTVEQLNPNLLEKDKLDNEKEINNEQMEIDNNQSEEDGYESNYDDDEEEENELDEEEEESNDEDNYLDYDSDEKPFLNGDKHTDLDDCRQTDLNSKSNFEFNLNQNNNLDDIINNTENYLSNKHQYLNSIRNDILNYWFEKTRFTLKGGKLDKNSLDAFEQSTVKSIDHLLLNRLKLVKRTQLKRGNYEIIGKLSEEEDDNEKIKSDLIEKRKKEIYDNEIFDDSDFYHQLLRELVNNISSSNLNQTSKVNPKWLKLMKERFKSNKYVDTKATKSRKIRYKVHNELVNFMTPMTYLCNYDDEQHNNLIKSIFGNAATSEKTNGNDLDFNTDDDSD